jgi:hypothetical protein
MKNATGQAPVQNYESAATIRTVWAEFGQSRAIKDATTHQLGRTMTTGTDARAAGEYHQIRQSSMLMRVFRAFRQTPRKRRPDNFR